VAGFAAMAVLAKDLAVASSESTALIFGEDMVNVEESVFGRIESAFLACPADVTEWEFEDEV
jgi:hypothetical protein